MIMHDVKYWKIVEIGWKKPEVNSDTDPLYYIMTLECNRRH